MEQKNGEFKLEVLKILRGFQKSKEFSKKDEKRFKREIEASKLYVYYRDMYKKAIEEYRATFKDFYYQRDKAKMQYKKDVRNQVRVEGNGEHPNPNQNPSQQIQFQTQSGTKTKRPAEEGYGEL